MGVDDYYFELNSDVIKYVVESIRSHPELTIVELVCEYAFKNNIDIEVIGDAIRDNDEFMSMIAREVRPIYARRNIAVDEW